jgi:hypothetical protein
VSADATPDLDLAPLVGRRWESLGYREALVELIGLGWSPCGVGDLAVGLRSPSGRSASRVCPFDPAHPAFIELCRRCPRNPYLPRIELARALDGGGTLTVMEFLAPVSSAVAAVVARRWRSGDGDPDLQVVRGEALAVDAEQRERVPWWDGIDLNEGNIRRALDGRLAFIDLFCFDGAALYGQVLEDASVVRRRIPEAQGRHLLEIPYLARESSVDELQALRRAWDH